MTQNEHVYAICCRPGVAGDVISSINVKTIECYAVLNFEVASFSSFRDSLSLKNRSCRFREIARCHLHIDWLILVQIEQL